MRCARSLCPNAAEFVLEVPGDNIGLVACLPCTREVVLKAKAGDMTYRPIRKGLNNAKNSNKR